MYICSPYSGDVEANVELARRFSAFTVLARQIPLAPHLHYPQFMDDTDTDARELAMFFNRILLSKCEQLWAYIGRVSAGMRAEIEFTPSLWHTLVDHAEIGTDGTITFTFRDGRSQAISLNK